MSHQFSTETLRVNPPRAARFLRRSIPTGADYVPLAAETRADNHRPGIAAPDTWPIRLTRCGEHPGRYGDNTPTLRRVQDPR